LGRLVLATNRPSDLDEALLDRMDEVLYKNATR
jgi:SpoVK/Ycf46/Vps4 family AAA+-type ATPase